MSLISMSRWVHLACADCRQGRNVPIIAEKLGPLLMDGTERCCWCGQTGGSDFYLARRSPELMPCHGRHKAELKPAQQSV